MTDQQVQLLANLLERAIGSVVVTHDRSKQRIDIPTYQQKLLSHWNRHWPDLDLNHPRHFTPTVTSDELHEQLLATVSRELEQHVRDGRVQTAAIVTVGGTGRVSPWLTWLGGWSKLPSEEAIGMRRVLFIRVLKAPTPPTVS